MRWKKILNCFEIEMEEPRNSQHTEESSHARNFLCTSQILYKDAEIRQLLLKASIHRASRWMLYQSKSGAQQMVGQVGGVSVHKRPLLTLDPDYVLKPLQLDHRGIREIGFYEAVRTACQQGSVQSYAAFMGGIQLEVTQALDVLAMYITLSLGDQSLTDSEQSILNSWRKLKKEAELLRRLQNYTALYYGVVQLNYIPSAAPSEEKTPYGVSVHSHLLLQDLTRHFSKPCVIDIKIGPHSYEPDAPEEKRARERSKYPQQTEFGFRIVGMRIYDPSHEDACDNGFQFFSKEFGRSLSARDALKSAFRTYFSAGVNKLQAKDTGGTPSTIRTRSLSNILTQIRSIQSWFDDNIYFCFYASSLLIIYEGDPSDSSMADMVSVKMIDFGRVRRQAGGDPGYSLGLQTIREILVELMEEETTAA
jgi:hypothetical protein